jgi:hypothetical protein
LRPFTRQAGNSGDHRRLARWGWRNDGYAELNAFGRRNIGTVSRPIWDRAGGEIGRRAGVETRRRRNRTSAGTDRTRAQSGTGRNGQRAAGVGGLCRGSWRRTRCCRLGHRRFAGRKSRRRNTRFRNGWRHGRLLGERRPGRSRLTGYGNGPYRASECYPQYGGRNVTTHVPPNFKPLTCLDNPAASGSWRGRYPKRTRADNPP